MPVILVSGYSDGDPSGVERHDLVVEQLAKPVRPAELCATISSALSAAARTRCAPSRAQRL